MQAVAQRENFDASLLWDGEITKTLAYHRPPGETEVHWRQTVKNPYPYPVTVVVTAKVTGCAVDPLEPLPPGKVLLAHEIQPGEKWDATGMFLVALPGYERSKESGEWVPWKEIVSIGLGIDATGHRTYSSPPSTFRRTITATADGGVKAELNVP
jgi:hypothetical protein